MSIEIASLAGFCFGVQRAVTAVYDLIDKKSAGERIYTLGPLIHNRSVTSDLEERGVFAVNDGQIDALFESASESSAVIIVIRTHGIEKSLFDKLGTLSREKTFFRVVDLTCPFVAKIHDIARRETDGNSLLAVFGDPSHPEVKGIVSYSNGQTFVLPSEQEALLFKMTEIPVVLVAQTTQKLSEWEKVQLFFKNHCTNIKIFDTICSVTENRQREAEALAKRVGVMLVVGGKDSSNTRSLYKVAADNCAQTFLVEKAEELYALPRFKGALIGITAGASTPRYIIEEVKQTMSEIIEENFAELLEGSLKTLNTGDIVTGIVESISSTEIHVSLSSKGTGILPADEVALDPETGKPVFKVGDEIEAFVVRVSDVEGVVGLSRKRIERMSDWKKLVEASKDGTVLEGKVTEAVKGGVIITIGYSKVFVPASQTGLTKSEELSTLVGTTHKFTVIDIDEQRNHAVGSIKAVLRTEHKAAVEAFWENIEEGQKFNGTVKSLTSYGAFVDLGGIDGMVHVTELSWSRIKSPADVVSVGDKIDVYVKSFDREKKRISLGCKTAENCPWNIFTANFAEGDVATVKIVGLTPFGAFAEIIPDVDGLIHISQIADKKIGNPAEYLSIGQTVQAKIIGIDTDKQKVSLSIRALLTPENGEEATTDEEPKADNE